MHSWIYLIFSGLICSCTWMILNQRFRVYQIFRVNILFVKDPCYPRVQCNISKLSTVSPGGSSCGGIMDISTFNCQFLFSCLSWVFTSDHTIWHFCATIENLTSNRIRKTLGSWFLVMSQQAAGNSLTLCGGVKITVCYEYCLQALYIRETQSMQWNQMNSWLKRMGVGYLICFGKIIFSRNASGYLKVHSKNCHTLSNIICIHMKISCANYED